MTKGRNDVWALGDCASIPGPDGKPYPALAQHAIREGPHAARNVLAALDGRQQTPFAYDQLGMLVSLLHKLPSSRISVHPTGSHSNPATTGYHPICQQDG